ncbi:homeobox protein knotted-1-like 3 [Actinidia rufa]|uniref:Homeobox protein knotted-1-like 3 n=1 Tax=Actinidia rufa TaxID=165716 RepID=A0A7J0FTA3_9ERIC|nr:homeobox protein knotted-1-like 3 [Actinidia rufa]
MYSLYLGQPSPEEAGKAPKNQHRPPPQVGVGPTWLNSAILRQQSHYSVGSNFLNLHTNSDSPTSQASNQWLSRSILQRNVSDVRDDVQASSDSMLAAAISHESAYLNNDNNDNRAIGGNQNARYKSEILSHLLYEQLLSAHVACLRIATPVDQLPRIDAQLAQSQNVVAKYSALGQGNIGDDKELDQFMNARYKSEILSHLLYEQLLSAHVACLRIAMPVDQLSRIDAQLAQSQNVVAKYSALGQGNIGDDKEFDHIMVRFLSSIL